MRHHHVASSLGPLALARVILAVLGLTATGLHAENRFLGLEQRIEARHIIETVYWNHRTWPEVNAQPKPDLEAVLSPKELRQRVEDSLRLSDALAGRWQRPITAEDLQAELDRMVSESRDPERLAELFAALDNDPLLIAECLARPLLAERRAREAFATDSATTGALKRRAQAEWERFRSGRPLEESSGRYSEIEWVRSGPDRARWELMAEGGHPDRVVADPPTWKRLNEDLAAWDGEASPGKLGPFRDEPGFLSVSRVLERDADHVRIATVTWPKPGFDGWWAEHRDDYSTRIGLPSTAYELAPIGTKSGLLAGWTSTNFTGIGVPGGRVYHTAVWTGSEMIVYGGITSGTFLADGGRYFPDTNSWLALPAASQPAERAVHTAVWSGTYMVVFGGWSGGSAYLRDGARYDPTANAWYSMSTTNAPTVRGQHTAVWSGIFMIVYGGFNGSGFPSDGGSYLPGVGGGTWFPMNTTGAPGGRIKHAAVMCDTADNPVMVIWGGEAGAGPLATGGRFDVGSLTWDSMSNVGQPGARTNLSGVWGSALDLHRKVLLWGGNDGSVDRNDGAAYDPTADDWEALPATALEPRQGHTAVWTGYTMILWGGFSGASTFNNGRIYNPVNRVWRSVTTTGAPSARIDHTAVWRKQANSQAGQMIVWGGDDGTYTNRGGVYTPNGDYVFAMFPSVFEVTREGTVQGAVNASLITLNGLSYSLTVSEDYALIFTNYEHNPISAGANGFDSTAVDVEVDGVYPAVDLSVMFTGDGGDSSLTHTVTMRVQDFDVSCSPSTLDIPEGGSGQSTCTVSSENWFSDPVLLSCNGTWATCDFAQTPVTPPGNGNVDSVVTITPSVVGGPTSFTHEVRASGNGASRYFDLQVNITGDDEIFSDGFESSDVSGWDSAVP